MDGDKVYGLCSLCGGALLSDHDCIGFRDAPLPALRGHPMTADTPNLEAITSDTALERWPVRSVERAVVLAARAELAELRAATPKIDGVPTVEGWYWHREKNSRLKGVPWSLVWTNGVRTLSDGDREIVIWTQPVEEGSAQQTDIQDFEFAKHEFYGPLTPPKETP